MKKVILAVITSASIAFYGQSKEIPALPQGHPRYLTTASGKSEVTTLIENEPWAKDVFIQLSKRTDKYADRGSEWLTSRLQMYWNSHATDVFIKGEYYDHAGGEPAPYPTVMYTGARSHGTNYVRPKLDDIEPYQEDPRGMRLANGTLENKPYEWVNLSKTGNIIQSINVEILGIARDAAFLWWITGEKKYAEMAASVFDTYMTGIYYRNVPKDLNHGHQQTLVGMSSFEVIHEDALNALVPLYDFLYDYLKVAKHDKMDIYAAAFKKWADNIIDNGVPHNNWDLIQARFIVNIGLILEDDSCYADGKGRQYYIDLVRNESSIRQWSLSRLADYGFDSSTGIWAESPGYSTGVVADYANFMDLFDTNLGIDLTEDIPVLTSAVAATPQYLFPNGVIVGFGDTHPGKLRTDFFERMIRNAQTNSKPEQEKQFTAMLKLFNPSFSEKSDGNKKARVAVTSFFSDKPLEIDHNIPAGKIDDYVTPTFYAPNAGWVVQRNGMDPQNSLMISLNSSEGNHMHANGISMELYGRGLTLGPDAGIGRTLYSGQDYLEYYSQFPAHNTVCVDGISSYPVMKSNHGFKLLNCYPEPGADVEYQPVSYSEVYFREPESQADQNRMMSIVTTGDTPGYYVDVFRSRREDCADKMHDYFYHNLGQEMSVTSTAGDSLDFRPTEDLAFAGAHIYAYSYLFDKKKAVTDKDVRTVFNVLTPDKNDVSMTLWMKGEKEREIFSALSPMTEGLSRTKGMPYDIKEQPTLTYVARQHGEAWKRPFVAVYEPSSLAVPGGISSVTFPEVKCNAGDTGCVGICVEHKDGGRDYIISSDDSSDVCSMGKMKSSATYSLWNTHAGKNKILLMGNGTYLEVPGIKVESKQLANVLVEYKDNAWVYTSSHPCTVTINKKKYKLEAAAFRSEIIK